MTPNLNCCRKSLNVNSNFIEDRSTEFNRIRVHLLNQEREYEPKKSIYHLNLSQHANLQKTVLSAHVMRYLSVSHILD